MVLECFGRVLPRGKSGLERFQGAGVAGELVCRHASEHLNAVIAGDDRGGAALGEQLALGAVPGVLAGGPADLEALHVVVLVVAVSDLAEADLERYVFPRVAVGVEPEDVQALVPERCRRAGGPRRGRGRRGSAAGPRGRSECRSDGTYGVALLDPVDTSAAGRLVGSTRYVDKFSWITDSHVVTSG